MLWQIRIAAVAAVLLSCACSTGDGETALRRFASLYGIMAHSLAQVQDASSAEKARDEIYKLAPKIRRTGNEMAEEASGTGAFDRLAMKKVAENQRLMMDELVRLREKPKLWLILKPALSRTSIVQAMPPR